MKAVMVNTIESIENRRNVISDSNVMISKCGGNTGNVCFVESISNQIIFDNYISAGEIGKEEDPSRVYVLPAANWINKTGKVLKEIMLPLEKQDIKLAVLGLGIQTDKESNTISKLSETLDSDIVRALKILSEHSVSIGIRGFLTAELLDKLGIHNWQVIGCPSFYEPYRKWRTWGGKHCTFYEGKVVCNISPGSLSNLHLEHMVLERAIQNGNYLIMQCTGDLTEFLFEQEVTEKVLKKRFPEIQIKAEEVQKYISEFGRIFYDKYSWDDFLLNQEICFSYGSRFHGNMVAFTNGIPALWIKHDSRIVELIDVMKLPCITYDQFQKSADVKELYDLCIYDHDFEENYLKMSNDYITFLNKNGLPNYFEEKE